MTVVASVSHLENVTYKTCDYIDSTSCRICFVNQKVVYYAMCSASLGWIKVKLLIY